MAIARSLEPLSTRVQLRTPLSLYELRLLTPAPGQGLVAPHRIAQIWSFLMHFPTSIRIIGLTCTGKAFLYMMVVLSLLPTLSLRRGRTMMRMSTVEVWQINGIKLIVCPRIALWWVDADTAVFIVAENEINAFARNYFPDLLPSVPSLQERTLDIHIANPFDAAGNPHHPKRGHWKETAIGVSVKEVNGLVKFARKTTETLAGVPPERRSSRQTSQGPTISNQMTNSRPAVDILRHMPWIPPDFGRGFHMTAQDESLLRFCGYCELRSKITC